MSPFYLPGLVVDGGRFFRSRFLDIVRELEVEKSIFERLFDRRISLYVYLCRLLNEIILLSVFRKLLLLGVL